MVGGILMAIAMLVVMPPLIMLTGAVWSALIGQLATDDADQRAEGRPA